MKCLICWEIFINHRYIMQRAFQVSFPCQITFNRRFEYSHERQLVHMADFRMVSSSKGARFTPPTIR